MEPPDLFFDPSAQPVGSEHLAVRLRRRCEPGRYAHSSGAELCGHLAQGGVLATHAAQVLPAEFSERYDA